jgi:opacity protein-like surface antigen
MTQPRKLCRILSLTAFALMFVSVASVLAAGDDHTTTTISITKHVNPDIQVQLIVVLNRGPKGTAPPPATPVLPQPQQSGTSTFVLDQRILGSAKPHKTEITIYDCGDGKYVAALEGADIDTVCPKNKRKKLVVVLFGDNAQIDGDTGVATVIPGSATQPSGGGATPQAPPNPLINVQVDGGAGIKRFVGANNCESILVALPSATCNAGNQSFAFSLGGTVKITRFLGFRIGDTHANAISRHAATSSPGTFTDASTFQPNYFLLMPGLYLPIQRFTLFADGGLAYHFIKLNETQTTGSGSTNVSSLHDSGAGYGVGAGVQVNASKQFGLRVEYQYLQAQKNQLLNEHNHVVLFGVFYSFW